MLSVIVLVPVESPSVIAICGCISVGNPGYGSVLICVWRRRCAATTLTASSDSSISAPISINFAEIVSKCLGITFLIRTSPLVAAAAIMKVPASIWSGITEYSVSWNFSTPLIRITSVPAPRILAPMLFKKFATSTICGSFAAFSITVLPCASDAAIIILIVAPTETTSK